MNNRRGRWVEFGLKVIYILEIVSDGSDDSDTDASRPLDTAGSGPREMHRCTRCKSTGSPNENHRVLSGFGWLILGSEVRADLFPC